MIPFAVPTADYTPNPLPSDFMILIDYNGVAIASLMGTMYKEMMNPPPNFLGLARHVILNGIRAARVKGKGQREVVIACDSGTYWRRQYFEHYKGSRTTQRKKGPIQWGAVYEALDKVRGEIHEFFPYRVLRVDGCEADDIIAVLAKYEKPETVSTGLFEKEGTHLVVSKDNDFEQLLKHSWVELYNPAKAAKVTATTQQVMETLKLKLLEGESSDGIPNVLSDGDTLVTEGKRQKPLRADAKEALLKEIPEALKDNYERNSLMIDFDRIPEEVVDAIRTAYHAAPLAGSKSKMFRYLTQQKLVQLLERIHEF